jgi:hypothetical protein
MTDLCWDQSSNANSELKLLVVREEEVRGGAWCLRVGRCSQHRRGRGLVSASGKVFTAQKALRRRDQKDRTLVKKKIQTSILAIQAIKHKFIKLF